MSYRKNLLCCAMIFIAASCKQNTTAHLSPSEMEKVITDIQLADVYSTMTKKDSTSAPGLKNNDSLVVYYKEVFRHHDITPEAFVQSLTWYRAHPEELDSIYSRAMANLDRTGKIK